jgi:hypothetical protein
MLVLISNPDEQARLVKDIYKLRLGRYIGVIKTVAKVKASGYDFLGLRERVKEVLIVYDTYYRGKADRYKPYGLL